MLVYVCAHILLFFYLLDRSGTSLVQIGKNIQHTIVNISLPIRLTCVFGAQKNRLDKTVLLSTHNICLLQK